MEEILQYFTQEKFLITLLTAITTAAYALTAKKLLTRNRARRDNRKENFFNILLKGLEKDTIKTHKDLINVYKGSTDLSTEDLSYRYGLNRWLRELLAKVIGENSDLKFDKNQTEIIVSRLTEFIDNNEEVSPFSDLPDSERNMLSDITSFVNNGDKNSANRKIKELGSVIQTRTEEQRKIEGQNRWAIPLAIVGVILTVVFGLLSIFT
ncbi:hypothetical protein PJJ26_08055 [Tenacibaculum finnmarkense]|nr:hypothetical protein PJJ26_08055 [Tenacibaculum finnmarkense]